jgi:hypothetical protein
MKTKAALALSLTGILLTGSAAIAANAQTLKSSHAGISDDVKNVLVTDDSATRTAAPAPARVVPKAAPKAATQTSDGKKADDKKASAAKKAARPAEPGDDNGGKRTTPEPGDDKGGLATAQTFTGSGTTTVTVEPGDDKGGLRTTPEPGDDNGGLRAAQAPRAAQAGDDKGGSRKAPEPGDDSGGHGGHGSDD